MHVTGFDRKQPKSLRRLASFSTSQACAGSSEHARRIDVLDICAESGFNKFSVMSTDE